MNHKNVVILSHPRSGSTNLFNILNTHPALNLAMEPFHVNFSNYYPGEESYCKSLENLDSFDKALNRIFEKYNGMKLQSYRFTDEMILHLMNRKDCFILFQIRENILKTVVSTLIAEQNSIWQKEDLHKIGSAAFSDLKPLAIEGIAGIENRINSLKNYITRWNPIIEQKSSVMKITYEDLFTKGIESSFSYIRRIFAFIGFNMPLRYSIIDFIDPSKQKINDYTTYMKVPNINEIVERFESKENGFLLSDE